MLSQTMKFFDINYGEFASVTGTNLNTSSAAYGYDNRSDAGNVTWNSVTGDLIYDFGNTLAVDSFFINAHNWAAGSIMYGDSLTSTLTVFSNLTTNAYFYKHASTITTKKVKFTFSSTQDSNPGYAGELIATKQKFQLNYNPSTYRPMLNPIGVQKQLYNGKTIWNETSNIFNAEIGWNFLMGAVNTLTNTDLQNVTELVRQRSSFLFWPNAGNSFVNMNTWRPQDVYKAKILDVTTYEFPSPAIDYAIMADYTIQEVQ